MKRKRNVNVVAAFAVTLLLAVFSSCEKAVYDDHGGKVRLKFVSSNSDISRGYVGDYFTKLALMLFTPDGEKSFDKVKTQTADDDDFGTFSLALQEGSYQVVAVGHSSPVTPSIKSTEMVQFTAQNGIKNTDTFCYYGTVTIDEDGGYHELTMNRLTAMLRIRLTDEEMPDVYAGMRIDYTGGSANFNPSTGEGCTKSSQSEFRTESSEYQCFTFPYMSEEGKLKVTLYGLDADKNVLATKVLNDVPVTRNRITVYEGPLFGDSIGKIYQTGFGITVNGDWAGEDHYTF